MSNNDSKSSAQTKISFDINNIKKPVDTKKNTSAKKPLFSIKREQTELTASAKKSSEMINRQAPTSERPVFDIHPDTKPQKNDGDSVSAMNDSSSNAEPVPKITVQGQVPDFSANITAESQMTSLASDSLKSSLTNTGSNYSSATSQMSASVGSEEQESENVDSSLDSLTSLNQALAKLQQKLDANSLSLAANNSANAATNVEESLTREAYQSSVSTIRSEEASIKTEESEQLDQTAQPQPPRPPKIDDEKVTPIFVTPEENKSKQSTVEWNGPQVQKGEEQQSSYETRSSSQTNAEHYSRETNRPKHHSKKKSGVLGKSFLAMLGIKV